MNDFAQDHAAKLAAMANQMADFFKSYPQDQASASIAEHINQFWGRKMRTDFLAAFRADNPALHPLVAKALPHIKAASAP